MMLLCVSLNQTVAQNNPLENKITINVQKIAIDKLLDSLSRSNNCHFTYNSDVISANKIISLQTKNEELESVLRKIIPDTSLTFQVVNRHIIIVPAEYKTHEVTSTEFVSYVSYRNIAGKITDQTGRTGLPYASIGIRGKHIGSITNLDGDFSLTITNKYSNDTLVVSYVGYKNTEIPISDISNENLIIKLKEDFISLQEVVIRNNDPNSIVRAAVKKIHYNYPQKTTNLTSFYRESVLKNNKYMVYVESVLDIYKNPYNESKVSDRVKVFKSRKLYDVSRLDTISFRLKGGINGCLQMDIIKNRPEFLDPEFMENYKYYLTDISTYNNKAVYVIEFKPLPNLIHPLLEGKMIIETNSLAIVSAEFKFHSSRLSELTHRFITKGHNRTKVRPLHIEYAVNYRNINGKYYLNHTLGNLKFKVRNKKKLFSQTFSTSFEMAITKLDTVNVRKFKVRETIKPKTVLSTENLSYDQKFWGNQNFIKPEDNIKEAIKRITNSMQQVAMDTSASE